jgi:serine/threonine-protein kinase
VGEPTQELQQSLPERYTIERELGRGGMATVYLARESHPSRQVAIKVLNPGVTARLARERFLREVDHTSKLTHPHIVPVFAAGNAGDTLFFVMPYVSGESLRQRLDREGALPVAEAVRIAQDVAEALEYAHRRNLIHRDVKPENILLHEGQAFVTDFGIAKAIDEATTGGVTAEGFAVGTPAYMSPEQAAGRANVDSRSDVYSLACVLYEMLVGEPPFSGKSAQLLMSRHMNEPPPSLRTARDTLPPALEAVVLRALAKSPADRYRTAAELSGALGDAVADRPFPVRGAPTAGGRGFRSRRAILAAAAALLLTAVVVARFRAGDRAGRLEPRPRGHVASVAVLPFENLSGRRDFDQLVEAVTDEVIAQLAQVPRLRVTSRNSVMALRGARLTTPQVTDTLGVGHLIVGSLRVEGGRAVLTLQLVDSTDAHLWADRFERPAGEMFRAHTDIGRMAAAGLVRAVPGLSEPPAAVEHEHSAGEVFHQSGAVWLKRRTADGLRRAIEAFDSALSQDPRAARSYAELSKAYSLSLPYRYQIGLPAYRAAGLALALANRAVSLEPRLAAGYEARAYIGSRSQAPLGAMARDFERARELDPNAADAASWYALVLGQQGRHEEGLAEAERAVALDPLSAPRRVALAAEALRSGRYETAIREARRAAAMEPGLMLPRAWEARALVLAGRAAECLTMELGPHAGLKAVCLHAAGHAAPAEAVADSLVRGFEAGGFADQVYTDAVRAEDLATYYAVKRDAARALSWVERAYDLSPLGVEPRLLDSELFDAVRQDQGFAAGLRRAQGAVWDRVRRESAAVALRPLPGARRP